NWMMSEEAQVGVLAKDKDVVSRGDLSSNEFSDADPRLVTINEVAATGDTPVAIHFQEAFNAPNSPWLTLVRDAVLGDGANVDADNDEITAGLVRARTADAATEDTGRGLSQKPHAGSRRRSRGRRRPPAPRHHAGETH